MKKFLPFSILTLTSVLALPSLSRQQQPSFRSDVEVVNVLCTVTDGDDRYVTDLKKEDFTVYEDDIEQEVRFFSFESGDDAQPLNVVLLVDTSGSVKDKLAFEQEAASIFFRQVLRQQKDLAAVIQFDSEINLAQDFTFDLATLDHAIEGLRSGGATKLHDAIYLASHDVLRHEVGRRVLVVLSDGEDTQSMMDRESAITAAQKNDVIIFGIGVRSGRGGSDFGTLKRFADSTGGSFFNSRVRVRELREAFARINDAIKNQYNLGYVSSNRLRDGAYREIEVEVRNRRLKVHHRRGYYAPSSP